MNIAITVALLPALFTEDGGESPSVTTVLISAPLTTAAPTTTVAPTTTTAAPPTTAATAPPTTAAPVKRKAAAVVTTTTTTAAPRPKPKPTTTTAAPAPAPKPAPAPSNEESGRATWYELEGARAGICAHKTLPFGTIVTVTNTNTGKSIQCEVGDRGPFVEGYIIDLFRTDFEKLQPTSKGWFPARITW